MNTTIRSFRPGRAATLLLTGAVAVVLTGCSVEANVDEGRNDYHHLAAGSRLTAESSYVIQREFAGLVAPRQDTQLAFELGGELAALRVDEGDRVSAGQVLAELDTRLLRAQRDDLVARRQEIQARLDLNGLNSERIVELQGKGFAADQQMDELDTERRALTAQLARLAAELDANATRLDQSVLKAPFDGAISARLADRGAVVAAGSPVLVVLEDQGMEARVGVPVRLLGDVSAGDPVTVRVGVQVLQGRVLAIGSDVTRATLTVPVRIALPDTAVAVPGDQAYLGLDEVMEESGYWIPVSALTDGLRGLWNVYVMAPEEGAVVEPLYRIQARDVRVIWAEEERAFVRGALADGEWVVSAGLHRLVPGQQVRLDAGPTED